MFQSNSPMNLDPYQSRGLYALPTSYQKEDAKTRTTDPKTTGTSVLALKCKNFVILGADTCVSYGSLSRFRNVPRISKVGDYTLVGASGEYSDYQFMIELLQELVVADKLNDDGKTLSPKEIHSYLTRVMYNKRNKFDPFYNDVVLGGFKNGKSFFGESRFDRNEF
jgi:20S proteasome subunit beta 7